MKKKTSKNVSQEQKIVFKPNDYIIFRPGVKIENVSNELEIEITFPTVPLISYKIISTPTSKKTGKSSKLKK